MKWLYGKRERVMPVASPPELSESLYFRYTVHMEYEYKHEDRAVGDELTIQELQDLYDKGWQIYEMSQNIVFTSTETGVEGGTGIHYTFRRILTPKE